MDAAVLPWRGAPSVRAERGVERLVAVGYGLAYDRVVSRFAPFQSLVEEVAGLVARSAARPPHETKVLDVACGTGTVANRLAAAGYTVVALDAVEHLISVARERAASGPSAPAFHHSDAAHDPVPGAGSYDVVVSMHTLYWHPHPDRLLAACRRALRPGGHGVFLTYSRPARVIETSRTILARDGFRAAMRALRWLVPTAIFEALRRDERRYMTREAFHEALAAAGFEVLESRPTFLADISLLAWARARETS